MAPEQTDRLKCHSDYTIGWVCAILPELTAATAMLDEVHKDELPSPENEDNTYTRGRIGKHHIVIACLPAGTIGTNAAAALVKQMLRTFPKIRFGLMVGVGGGIPNLPHNDVRLGDVVVNLAQDGHGGVVQWDFGKVEQTGFRRTGHLQKSPTILRSAVIKLGIDMRWRGPRFRRTLIRWLKNGQGWLPIT